MTRRKPFLKSSKWPDFVIHGDKVDGNIPVARLKNWEEFLQLTNAGKIAPPSCEMLFRGQRNASWGLTPSIARMTEAGTYQEDWATRHLENFKYSIRGRTKIPVSQMGSADEIWALGQHYGLWTPLLDWSHSPFVAMFFAMHEEDPKHEKPKNYSRAIFGLNKSNLETFLPEDLFVNPLSSDHDRLISQDGLFTLSPSGETSLETTIINSLAENEIDVDDPLVLKDYIFKLHIPIETEDERQDCLMALRRMNLHFANLYPDLTGSSLHCNELISNEVRSEQAELRGEQ